MTAPRDSWEKPRSNGTHLTDAEKRFITQGFRECRRVCDVARDLKCSSRIVSKYYARLRGDGRIIKPRSDRVRGPLPDRFYHSNFEPS